MTSYFLPFLLGLLVGVALVLLAELVSLVSMLLLSSPIVMTSAPADPLTPSQEAAGRMNQQKEDSGNLPLLGQQQQQQQQHVTLLSPLLPSPHNNNNNNNNKGCPDRPLHLCILVLSAPGATLRRTAIRGTWFQDYRSKEVQVSAKFLVGTLELEPEKVESLRSEEALFGDILLLDGLKDSYWNLSLKVLQGMQWASRNLATFDYLVKVDDDSYVRIEGVASALRRLDCDPRLYWGYFMGHAFPEPTGKWAEDKWLHCPHYLPYAMGGGYVLAGGVVSALMRFSRRLVLYNNEDVTVAGWLAPYRLTRRHDVRFDVESQSHGCNNGYLITHKVSVRSFYAKYTSLLRNGTLCVLEREVHPAYIYNWTGSPLECCDRVKGLPVR